MPVVIRHEPIGMGAGLAGQVGANHLGQVGFNQNMAVQSQMHQRERLDQAARDEDERRRQNDIQNQFQQDNLNRQWQRDDQQAQYNQQRIGLGDEGLDIRRQGLQQRLQELEMKHNNGMITEGERQEGRLIVQELRNSGAMARTNVNNQGQAARQDDRQAFQGEQNDLGRQHRDLMDQNRQQRAQQAMQLKVDQGESSLQVRQMQMHLQGLYRERGAADAEARSSFMPGQRQAAESRRDKVDQQIDQILDIVDRIQPAAMPAAPAAPQAPQFPSDGPENARDTQQGAMGAYQIGQVIQTPKGAVRIVGFDQDGMPLVEPGI